MAQDVMKTAAEIAAGVAVVATVATGARMMMKAAAPTLRERHEVWGMAQEIEVNIHSLVTKADYVLYKDNDVKLENEFDVEIDYADTNKLTFKLGNTVLGEYAPSDEFESGRKTYRVRLTPKAYGNYKLTASATSTIYPQGNVINEITLRYLPFAADYSFFDMNGDPIIALQYNNEVDKVVFDVRKSVEDKIAFSYNYIVEHGADSIETVTLPFLDKGMYSGDYTVTATAYDEQGRTVDPNYGSYKTNITGYNQKF